MQLGRDFVRAVRQLEREKKLNLSVITSTLEAAIVSAYKKYSGHKNIKVEVDIENGNIYVYELKEVVEEVKNPDTEISVEEAKKLGYGDIVIGDVVEVEVSPEGFGRIAAQTAKQVVIQRIKEAERELIYREFSSKVGDIITGIVFKVDKDIVLVDVGSTEAILPAEERIPTEKYLPGMRKKFYVLRVRKTTKGPVVELSRTHPNLLKRLLELEVPEIRDGVIEIKHVIREPGLRAKVAVVSYDVNVDPVGACVGHKGSRVKAVMEELNGERIDIVVWDRDLATFVKNALSPAKVEKIEPLLEEKNGFRVYVHPSQLSLAIGKEGQNVRLAAKLTGCKIDIKPLQTETLRPEDLFTDLRTASVSKESDKKKG